MASLFVLPAVLGGCQSIAEMTSPAPSEEIVNARLAKLDGSRLRLSVSVEMPDGTRAFKGSARLLVQTQGRRVMVRSAGQAEAAGAAFANAAGFANPEPIALLAFDEEVLNGIGDLLGNNATAPTPVARAGMLSSEVELMAFADEGNDNDALLFAFNDRNYIESLSHTWSDSSYAAADFQYDTQHNLTGVTYRIKRGPNEGVIILEVGADGQLLPDFVAGDPPAPGQMFSDPNCLNDGIALAAGAVTVVVAGVIVGEAVAHAYAGYRVFRAISAASTGFRASRLADARTWIGSAINRTTVMAEAAYAQAAEAISSRWNNFTTNCI